MFTRLFNLLTKPSAKYSVLTLIISGCVIGFGVVLTTIAMVNATGSIEFCMSCHELQIAYKEYQESAHYQNRSGVIATCADCHLPYKYPKKLFAKASRIVDVWHHLMGSIDTPDKYEAKRLHLAQSVWKDLRSYGSEPCMACHNLERMSAQKQSNHAVKAHARARKYQKTCIDCHQGFAHVMPKLPLPEKARPLNEEAPIRCAGCHSNFRTALSVNHPDTDEPSIDVCTKCHIPGKQDPDKENNFKAFMHASHAKRVDCNGCHVNASEGNFHLKRSKQ